MFGLMAATKEGTGRRAFGVLLANLARICHADKSIALRSISLIPDGPGLKHFLQPASKSGTDLLVLPWQSLPRGFEMLGHLI